MLRLFVDQRSPTSGACTRRTLAEADRQADLGNVAQERRFYNEAINTLAPNSALPYVGNGPDDEPRFGLIFNLEERSDWVLLNEYLSKAVKSSDLANNWEIMAGLAQAQDRLGYAAQAKDSYLKALSDLKGRAVYKGEVLPKGGMGGKEIDRANIEWGAGLQTEARTDYLDVISRGSIQ